MIIAGNKFDPKMDVLYHPNFFHIEFTLEKNEDVR